MHGPKTTVALEHWGQETMKIAPGGDRYARQRLVSGWSQEALASARVLVVGAGAVGNEVIAQLAMLGVGHVVVVDLDRIETSNLARTILFRLQDVGELKAVAAVRAVYRLNPDVEAKAMPLRFERAVGAGLCQRADLVIGCVDNLQTRVCINRLCLQAQTPWIDTGIDARAVSVQVVHPAAGVCFECTLPASARRRLAQRYRCADRLLVAARERTVPTVAPTAAIAGSMAAWEAVALLHARRQEPPPELRPSPPRNAHLPGPRDLDAAPHPQLGAGTPLHGARGQAGGRACLGKRQGDGGGAGESRRAFRRNRGSTARLSRGALRARLRLSRVRSAVALRLPARRRLASPGGLHLRGSPAAAALR